MKVLVAGAGGYLGSNLVQELHRRGHEVVGLDVRAEAMDQHKACLKEALGVDLRKPEAIKGKCDGIDTVISTVGLEFPKKDLGYWDIDYQANVNLLREAESAGVKKFMYVSVIHADKEGEVPPLIGAKREFEKRLRSSKLEWVVFRPTGYFKDIVNIFLRDAKKGKVRLVGDGEIRFNPLHPADFSEFIADNLETVNEVKEVGGPEVFTYNEVGRMAFEVINQPPKFSYMSPFAFKVFMWVMRLFKPLLYPLLQFSLWCMTTDMVAPQTGSRTIKQALMEKA